MPLSDIKICSLKIKPFTKMHTKELSQQNGDYVLQI